MSYVTGSLFFTADPPTGTYSQNHHKYFPGGMCSSQPFAFKPLKRPGPQLQEIITETKCLLRAQNVNRILNKEVTFN